MNRRLAEAAKAAMHDDEIVAEKGWCSKFCRQVVGKVYGEKYRDLFGATAILTGKNFQRAGYVRPTAKAGAPQLGDLLFKMTGSGGFGHVGIYVGGGKVAENSSTKLGRVSGAKGYRTLAQYGKYDLVGRLPEPVAKPAKKAV